MPSSSRSVVDEYAYWNWVSFSDAAAQIADRRDTWKFLCELASGQPSTSPAARLRNELLACGTFSTTHTARSGFGPIAENIVRAESAPSEEHGKTVIGVAQLCVQLQCDDGRCDALVVDERASRLTSMQAQTMLRDDHALSVYSAASVVLPADDIAGAAKHRVLPFIVNCDAKRGVLPPHEEVPPSGLPPGSATSGVPYAAYAPGAPVVPYVVPYVPPGYHHPVGASYQPQGAAHAPPVTDVTDPDGIPHLVKLLSKQQDVFKKQLPSFDPEDRRGIHELFAVGSPIRQMFPEIDFDMLLEFSTNLVRKRLSDRSELPPHRRLPFDQACALAMYTAAERECGSRNPQRAFYSLLNKKMRDMDDGRVLLPYIELVQSAISSLSTGERVTVYRGVNEHGVATHDWGKGTTLFWTALTSFSTDLRVTDQFFDRVQGGFLVALEAVCGAQIADYSFYPEDEYLIPAFTAVEVTSEGIETIELEGRRRPVLRCREM